MPEVRVNIPDRLYNSLEKLSMIMGTSVELTLVDLIKYSLEYVAAVDSHYHYKLTNVEKAVEQVMRGVEERAIRLRTKNRERIVSYVNALGKMLAIVKEVHDKIPPRVELGSLMKNPNIESIVKRHCIRVESPEKTLRNLVRNIKPIAGAFKITIIDKGSDVELVFENPAFLESFIGIGSRALRRKIRR